MTGRLALFRTYGWYLEIRTIRRGAFARRNKQNRGLLKFGSEISPISPHRRTKNGNGSVSARNHQPSTEPNRTQAEYVGSTLTRVKYDTYLNLSLLINKAVRARRVGRAVQRHETEAVSPK